MGAKGDTGNCSASDDQPSLASRVESSGGTGPTPFKPTARIAAIMVSFGALYSLSYSLCSQMGYGKGFTDVVVWGTSLAGIASNLAIIGVCALTLPTSRGRFGSVLRWVVVAAGVAWAFMAPFSLALPAVAGFLCGSCYLLMILCAAMIILDLSDSYAMPSSTVAIPCVGLMIAGAGVAKVAFYLFMSAMEEYLGFGLVCAVGLSAVLVAVTVLPETSSNAVDLARRSVDAPRSLDDRIASARQSLAAAHGLSARESEVMTLLLEGLTRDQIAERLMLSSHTVKNYATSIYSKTGVHSVRELSALVMEGAREKDANRT